jgi:hypothetical protein
MAMQSPRSIYRCVRLLKFYRTIRQFHRTITRG